MEGLGPAVVPAGSTHLSARIKSGEYSTSKILDVDEKVVTPRMLELGDRTIFEREKSLHEKPRSGVSTL